MCLMLSHHDPYCVPGLSAMTECIDHQGPDGHNRNASVCSNAAACSVPSAQPQGRSDGCVRMQEVPDLYKHMLAVSYQLAAALEGVAMARALNRTVVFPRFYCWCDFDWYAVVLDGCSMGGAPGAAGADLFTMPFECPIDVLLNAHALYHRGFPYRQERFLAHPRTPLALAHDREPVLVIPALDTAALAQRRRMVRSASCHTCVRRAASLHAGGTAAVCILWAHE
jgi:hypothetical protein